MVGLLKAIFTWWNNATIGTLWFTKKHGVLIGKDELGNRYFEEKKPAWEGTNKRRWMIYNGTVEASRIPVDWHGWLHYTFDEPPTKAPFEVKSWEEDRQPNLTGTPNAYVPAGSLWSDKERAKTSGDYEAWSPE